MNHTNISGALAPDVNPILSNPNPFAGKVKYSLILHTIKDDIEITRIDSIEKLKDYSNNVTDYIIVRFKLYGSDFTKKLYPNRDNLELTLTLTAGDEYEVSNRYKLALLNHKSGIDSNPLVKEGSSVDTNMIFNVEAQCLVREVEGLRGVFTDGVFMNTTLYNMIQSEFVSSFSTVKVEGKTLDSVKLNIDKFDNDMTYKHIIVNTGTPILDLPSVFQNNNYGIYNGNIGTYVTIFESNPTVFIYPLYDFTQYDKKDKKLMIFSLNNKRLDRIENTFVQKDDVLKIICKSNITSHDTGENELIDGGSSIISSNPNLITNRNVNVTDSKVIYDKDSQISGTKIKDKKDKVNKDKYVGNQSNLYKVRSDYNKAMSAIYTLQWSFSNSELIYPGMPCSFIYEDNERDIVELKGMILNVYEVYEANTNTTNSLLTIAVQKPINDPSNDVYNKD